LNILIDRFSRTTEGIVEGNLGEQGGREEEEGEREVVRRMGRKEGER
jgi:hypothetical protein